MVVATHVVMPNNTSDKPKKNQNQGPRPYNPSDPNQKTRQPQSDKGMNKRNDQKDMDQLDDDGSPLRGSDDDIEPTR